MKRKLPQNTVEILQLVKRLHHSEFRLRVFASCNVSVAIVTGDKELRRKAELANTRAAYVSGIIEYWLGSAIKNAEKEI